MHWYKRKVVYTPEKIIVKKLSPVEGMVFAEGLLDVEIELSDGSTVRAEKRLCEFLPE